MNINATLFVQALSFAALIWFSVRFVWPMITDAMDERNRRIADGLAAAEAGKQALERSAQQSDEAIAQARGRATDILAQAEKRATQMIEEAKVSAKVEGDRLVAGAKAEVEQEVARAREVLRTQVAALAVAGAEQILKREVDAKVHADLIAAVQKQL
ncbi:MAG: F0F1 ATP synthase subunit B [Betaproteobacteria bacterium]|nr:MAG: F0F1 ATP synthase subunit B [Betaproteobacteria bacterium]